MKAESSKAARTTNETELGAKRNVQVDYPKTGTGPIEKLKGNQSSSHPSSNLSLIFLEKKSYGPLAATQLSSLTVRSKACTTLD